MLEKVYEKSNWCDRINVFFYDLTPNMMMEWPFRLPKNYKGFCSWYCFCIDYAHKNSLRILYLFLFIRDLLWCSRPDQQTPAKSSSCCHILLTCINQIHHRLYSIFDKTWAIRVSPYLVFHAVLILGCPPLDTFIDVYIE